MTFKIGDEVEATLLGFGYVTGQIISEVEDCYQIEFQPWKYLGNPSRTSELIYKDEKKREENNQVLTLKVSPPQS